MSSPGPPTLFCHVCGREFGTQSLARHIPVCKEKWVQRMESLPKSLRQAVPVDPTHVPPRSVKDRRQMDTYNEEARRIYLESMPQCVFCGRRFEIETLSNHWLKCNKNSYGTNLWDEEKKSRAEKHQPRFRICNICGKQFGTHSLGIHQKSCVKKFEREQQSLPPAMRRQLPATLSADLKESDTTGDGSLDALNEQAFSDFASSLIPCENCGRKFLPDRLEVHLRSCKKQAGEKASSSTASSPSKKSIKTDVSAERLRVRQNAEPSPKPERASVAPSLVPCEFCGRKFLPDRLEIHLRSCRKHTADNVEASGTSSPSKRMSKKAGSAPLRCQYCGKAFSGKFMVAHLKACPLRSEAVAEKITDVVGKEATPEVMGDDGFSEKNFCMECGEKYSQNSAKFCSLCGHKRC